MRNLLKKLGKRVHDLRTAKGWSQEEFAHVCGLHRTYIGQIERGEKNISFGNLVKVGSVLSMNLSDLLAGLEDGSALRSDSKRQSGKVPSSNKHLLEIEKLVRRLGHQRTAFDETVKALEEATFKSEKPGRGGK